MRRLPLKLPLHTRIQPSCRQLHPAAPHVPQPLENRPHRRVPHHLDRSATARPSASLSLSRPTTAASVPALWSPSRSRRRRIVSSRSSSANVRFTSPTAAEAAAARILAGSRDSPQRWAAGWPRSSSAEDARGRGCGASRWGGMRTPRAAPPA
ncbi:hypothetical protein VTK56DRAFT_9427 [Thermocarpiscus australiensis]